jgi:ABC-type uncharacterized transport system substrate-binding protein
MNKRVLILNSYTLTGRPAREQLRVRSFLDSLANRGYRAGVNLEVGLIDSNDLAELEDRLIATLREPPDLIHAVGTPNALLALEHSGEIPIVYYGAHPEQVAAVECSNPRMRGVKLTLPFTSNYKNYRFLRKLLPGARRVYVPFFEHTVFCPEAMRQKHREFRRCAGGSRWVPMRSEFVGYRSLAALNDIVGLEYWELVYPDAQDLNAALESIDPPGAVLMAYNDSVYCAGAPRLLVGFGLKAGVPVIWNNNPEATQIGALAAIAGCFEEAGRICGWQAAHILDTGSTAGLETQTSTRTFASLNLERAAALNLSPSDQVLAYFQEVIHVAPALSRG